MGLGAGRVPSDSRELESLESFMWARRLGASLGGAPPRLRADARRLLCTAPPSHYSSNTWHKRLATQIEAYKTLVDDLHTKQKLEPFDTIHGKITKRFETLAATKTNHEPPPKKWIHQLAIQTQNQQQANVLIQVHQIYVRHMYAMDQRDAAAIFLALARAEHWELLVTVLENHRRLQLFSIDKDLLSWIIEDVATAKARRVLDKVSSSMLVNKILEGGVEASALSERVDSLRESMPVDSEANVDAGEGEDKGEISQGKGND